MEAPALTGAESVRWNLRDLYRDRDALLADLAAADRDAEAFAERYRGRLSELEAEELVGALRELEAVQDRLGRAYTYAYLYWSTNTEDAERGALLQKVREAYTHTGQRLIFFEVEWARLDEDRAEALLQSDALAPFKHYLEVQWLQRRHILSEGEERVAAEKDVTGRAAWNRYFDETLGASRFAFRDETLTEQEVLSKLHDPDRGVRRDAATSLTEGLERHLRTLTYCFNTLLADKAATDRLRGYDHWLASRNLSNEIADESVEALVEAVTSRYDLAERYYGLKARLLGLEGEMMDYDRYAPLGEAERRYEWGEARAVVLDAYEAFHPEMGDVALRFFEGEWIDAPAAAGKRGGAFSHGAVPSAHPYILMNYTGRARDVQTLAHELGHGVHQYLSREQGLFHADTPLTTAETASVFGEMLVFQRLVDRETAPENRLAMLLQKIDDSMATVFRQVSMNRFEDRIHTHRREEGELTADDFGRYWMETQRPMFGDALTLGDHYRRWWSYIPHFVHTPGYVYAYAFGELLVLALYARYREGQAGFADGYLDLLRAGGSDWPHALVGRLGIDLQDPGFWHLGLSAIEDLVTEAEAAARAVGT
ncbi:MAG: M3 family oligoendopeptidase [Rhodothermales bacterium]|nr:M3 family oligoendopeptidase [Rhodothermales bacterium]